MKRLLTVFTLCTAALIGADAATSPAAADGRRDDRRQVARHDRLKSGDYSYRERRDRVRHHHKYHHRKFRRHHRRHRHSHNHGHGYGHGRGHGYGYGRGYGHGHAYGHGHGNGKRHGKPQRHGRRHDMRHGGSYLYGRSILPDGTRIIIRLD